MNESMNEGGLVAKINGFYKDKAVKVKDNIIEKKDNAITFYKKNKKYIHSDLVGDAISYSLLPATAWGLNELGVDDLSNAIITFGVRSIGFYAGKAAYFQNHLKQISVSTLKGTAAKAAAEISFLYLLYTKTNIPYYASPFIPALIIGVGTTVYRYKVDIKAGIVHSSSKR
ncbi:hypothetical protein GOV08_01125 [Candidatus Woesearchaeota archaeon]|nr:hypothetical protein [Candidatus Woesearchaeota archaeon]